MNTIAHIDECSRAVGESADELIHVETPPAMPLATVLSDWQREARHGTCNTGRYRLPYFVWGSGPPIVFIHGLGDRARSFISVMAALRREFSCIGYDLPIGGADGARLSAYRHRDFGSDLTTLLDQMRIREAALFASSFGATIALLAMSCPSARISRAVLQGGFAHRRLNRWEKIMSQFARYWRGSLVSLPLRRTLLHAADNEVFRTCPEEWQFRRDNNGSLPAAAVARRSLMIPTIDLRSKLQTIRQPVLMLCGDRDPLVTTECEAPLLELLPNVARVELPNCGHYPQYTHAPLVAEIVRQFLSAPACRVH